MKLASCAIGEQGARPLAALLASPACPALQTLALANNRLGDAGCAAVPPPPRPSY